MAPGFLFVAGLALGFACGIVCAAGLAMWIGRQDMPQGQLECDVKMRERGGPE